MIEEYVNDLKQALDNLDFEKVEKISNLVNVAIKNGNNIFLCGNGGSAANPSHSAGDWSKEINARTNCLSDNTAAVTAWANDSDYSQIFSNQLKTYYDEGDILLVFSGSGNSSNVIKAVEYVNNMGGTTVGFTGDYKGKKGGKLAQVASIVMMFETNSMEIIEDLELIVCHIIKNNIKLSQQS